MSIIEENTQTRKRSVTSGDYSDDPRSGPLLAYVWPQLYGARTYVDLPPYWSWQRDFALRATLQREDMWAGAVYKTVTKLAAMGRTIKDDADSKLRVARGQALTNNTNMGQGWVPFMEQVGQDFLLTDNGCFIEIVRASKAASSKILGMVALSSTRCRRTGDAAVPVIYRGLDGAEHELRDYQVLMLSDMPSSEANFFGVGRCAASRCYNQIVKLAALEQYIYEKASGDGATEMVFVQGISDRQMQDIIATSDEATRRKGSIYYKGKVVVPFMGDVPLNVNSIQLKNVPDGFDIVAERQHCANVYADNLGIPVQEIIPLSGQGLGTGTQSIVLDDAARGAGMAAFLKWFAYLINEYVLPNSTTFTWDNEHDLRDQKQKADVASTRASTRAAQIGSGEISPAMARQLAVDAEDIPPELVPNDETAGGTLSDDQKPLSTEPRPAQDLIASAPTTPPKAAQAPGGSLTTKASTVLVDQAAILKAAAALYDEVVGG